MIAALPLKKLWNFVSSLFDLADFKRDAIATRRKRFQLLSLEDRIVPASPLYYEYGSPENGYSYQPYAVLDDYNSYDSYVDFQVLGPVCARFQSMEELGQLPVYVLGYVNQPSDGFNVIYSSVRLDINGDPYEDDDNFAPIAVDDTLTASGAAPFTVNVLYNDSDPDGDSLTVVGNTSPAHGTVTISPDGTATYTPFDPEWSGLDSFAYTVSDGRGGTATASVTVRRADMYWDGATGGSWADPLNWSTDTLPTANDSVLIDLPSTETVFVPIGFATVVGAVTSTASVTVAGKLSVSGFSTFAGRFDMPGEFVVRTGSASVPPPDEYGVPVFGSGAPGVLLTGGGTIGGIVRTAAGALTSFDDGDFQLTDGGRLNGAGWYQVSTNLSMSDTTRTVSNLNLRTDGVIDGAGDLRVTESLIWQGGEFGGEAGSKVSIVGSGRVANPQGGGEDIFTLNNRKLIVTNGKQLFIEHNLRLEGEAGIDNRGIVEVAGRFDEGIEIVRAKGSVARILNQGDWIGDGNRYLLPFVNDNGSVDVSTRPQLQLNTRFEDYRQVGTDATLALKNAIVSVNGGSIIGGMVIGGDNEAKLASKFLVDSQLDGAAKFRLGRSAGNQLWLDRVTFITDDRSLLSIDADVMLKDSICYLAGRTFWSGGDIKQFRGGDPEIPGKERPSYMLNAGQFLIDCDNTLYVEQFLNKGLVIKGSGSEGDETTIFAQYIDNQIDKNGLATTQVLVGTLVVGSAFDEHQLSGRVYIAENASLRFEGVDSVAKLYNGANFTGNGSVYIDREATWALQDGSIVRVNSLVVQDDRDTFLPGKITGKGEYTTDLITGNAFGSRLVIRNSAVLSSFDVSKVELVVAPTAYLGIQAVDGVDPDNLQVKRISTFSNTIITARSGSLIYTSGDDFYLKDNSEIVLDDAETSGPAVFEFRSSSGIRTSGGLDDESVILVGAKAILTRSPISAGNVSYIDVPIINDEGSVTLRGMTLRGTYTFNNGTKTSYYQMGGTTRLLDDAVIAWQGVRIDSGSFDLNGHTITVNGSGLIIGRPPVAGIPKVATLIARGKVIGDVINRGTVQFFDQPTNPMATFTVDGSLTLATNGTVVYRIGTHEIGVGSDFLSVTSTAKLGGTLKLLKTPHLDPMDKLEFVLMDYADRRGSIDKLDAADVAPKTYAITTSKGRLGIK